MAEYISRNDALKAIGETIPAMGKPDGSGERDEMTHAAMEMCAGIISVLKDIPVADVAPVVHGKWKIVHVGRTIKCSNCGRIFDRFVNGARLPEYCFCGAKMDGGEKANE